jgi:hypothetical protein
MMRDLREELLNIRGGDFPKWYSSLTKLERVEYSIALEQLSKEFRS